MLEHLAALAIGVIGSLGYPGVFLLMTLESALIPIPSEVVMPFSGFLVSTGQFSLVAVIVAGSLGNLAGSLIAYYLGLWGKEKVVRRMVRKFGRFVLISEKDLDLAERQFRRYGDLIVFSSRLLPAVRTLISLPAGISKVPLGRFVILTSLGSLFWSALLTYIGYALGQNWMTIGPVFRKFDMVIITALALLAGIYVYRKVGRYRR